MRKLINKLAVWQSTKPCLLLLLIAFLVYLPSLPNKFVWDDEQFIYKNEFVKQFDLVAIFSTNTIAGAGHNSNYYRPITTLSFATDYAIWKLNPIGFHLTNTLLHLGAGIILFKILRKINVKQSVAFLISLIFLIHPIQTEAVVYANSRGDSMYAFWGLLSLWFFLLAMTKNQIQKKVGSITILANQFTLFFLSSTSYLLSILSKEIGIAIVGLHGLFFTWGVWAKFANKQKPVVNKMAVVALIVNCLLAGFYLYLRATLLNFGNSFNFYDANNAYSSSLIFRLLTFSKVLLTYFKLLIIPYPLHMERDTAVIDQWFNPWTISALLIIFGTLFYGFKQLINKKPLFLLGALWFAVMLAPTSGIIPINGLIYEHWLYLPMIGFYICLFALIEHLSSKYQTRWGNNHHSTYFWPSLLVIYAFLTIRQNWLWANPIRFYNYTLQYSQSARLYNNLAMAYAEVGANEQAIENYQKSLQISDQYPQTYHNLANIYLEQNNHELAIDYYQQAIYLDPNFHFSYLPLLNLYLSTKDWPKALQLVDKIIDFYPGDPQLTFAKGLVLWQLADYQLADTYFNQAIKLANNNPELLNYLQESIGELANKQSSSN